MRRIDTTPILQVRTSMKLFSVVATLIALESNCAQTNCSAFPVELLQHGIDHDSMSVAELKVGQRMVRGFSNGFESIVRICSPDDSSILAETEESLLGGEITEIEAVDWDRDGTSELLVTLKTTTGRPRRWLFNQSLQSVGPSVEMYGQRHSLLVDPYPIDADMDGRLDLLNTEAGEEAILYRNEGGFFKGTGETVAYFDVFFRKTGVPIIEKRSLDFVEGEAKGFVIRVINGDAGKRRVTSAVVKVDGLTVIGPDDFRRTSGVITSERVTVRPDSKLEVELRGEPGSELAMIFFPLIE